MKKVCIISGISGQDGSYLAELLLNKNYEVHGIVRRHSVSESQTQNIEHIKNDLHLHYGDLTDYSSIENIIHKSNPDEFYNLAAMSHVAISFDCPHYTGQSSGLGVLNVLEAIRKVKPDTKLYQAGSSEMFGNAISEGKQNELTCLKPVSPYGVAKTMAHHMVQVYRQSYDMFACNGILFNHESPKRGSNFVTQKIIKGAVAIKNNKQKQLFLGNLHARRDWGSAVDYVKAMWLMLQHDKPDDYVISTGETHSVRYFCDYTFKKLGLNYLDYVRIDPKYIRPNELHYLCGDSSKAKKVLGWFPEYTLEKLIDEMIKHEMSKITN